MNGKTCLIAVVLCSLCVLILASCGTDGGDTNTDGDVPVYDGDLSDGDAPDGDAPDGDSESDVNSDGDREIESELEMAETDGDGEVFERLEEEAQELELPQGCPDSICVDEGWRDGGHCLDGVQFVDCGRDANGCPILLDSRDCGACCAQNRCFDERTVYGTVMRKDPPDFHEMVGEISYSGELRVSVNDGPRDQGQVVSGVSVGQADYNNPSTRIPYAVSLSPDVAAGRYHLAAFLDTNGNEEADKGDIATFTFIPFDLGTEGCVELPVLMDVVIPF